MERTCQVCGETFLQLDACELCDKCRKCESCSLYGTCLIDRLIDGVHDLTLSLNETTAALRAKRARIAKQTEKDLAALNRAIEERKAAEERIKALNKALGIE